MMGWSRQDGTRAVSARGISSGQCRYPAARRGRLGYSFLALAACLVAGTLSAAGFFGIEAGASCNGRGGLLTCPRADGDKFKYVVDTIATNGFSWARERLLWPAFNPVRGVFANVDRFVADNRYYEQKGVRPSWIFHKPPDWTSPRRNLPGDLGALYAFARRLAASVAPFPADWEIWNEPDLGHYPETAWDFAAAVKAGYLAVKAANPAAQVLMGSLCTERRYVRLGGPKRPAVTKVSLGMNPLGKVNRHWLRNLRLLKASGDRCRNLF